MLDIERLLKDYSVRYTLRKEGVLTLDCSQVFSGCISSKGSRTLTGAFLIDSGKVTYYCFRCGSHSLETVLELITGVSKYDLWKLYQEYDKDFVNFHKNTGTDRPKKLILPNMDSSADDYYKEYVNGRGFDCEYLKKVFKVGYTKHYTDGLNASIMNPKALVNRIVFPVIYEGQYVSWTTRTIDKDADIRYISCPDKLEVIPHKHLLYNIDNCTSEYLFIVEGIFDCIRGGTDFCATFGIEWTTNQLNLILKRKYKKVFILYDPETKAQRKATQLAEALAPFTRAFVIDISDNTNRDIGDYTDIEINRIKKEIATQP